MSNDRELKKHLKDEHESEVEEQELAGTAFAPCPVPGCETIHSLKWAGRWESRPWSRQGVTPFYRHLQQYSIKPELDGHEDHLKHMQSADGAVSCGGRSHYTVAVHRQSFHFVTEDTGP